MSKKHKALGPKDLPDSNPDEEIGELKADLAATLERVGPHAYADSTARKFHFGEYSPLRTRRRKYAVT